MDIVNKLTSHAQMEAVKEALRLAVLGALGALLAYLADLDQSTTVIVVTFVLRTIDKWVHKSEKTERNGLLPF